MVDGATCGADGEGAAADIMIDGAAGDVDGVGAAGDDSGCRSARGRSLASFELGPRPILVEGLAGVAGLFVCWSWLPLSSPVLGWLLAYPGGGRRR